MNEYFTKCVEIFVQHFFASKGLEAEWYWYRYEWQSRGSIHVHGLCRLKSDPDLHLLLEEIILGRKASRYKAIHLDQ